MTAPGKYDLVSRTLPHALGEISSWLWAADSSSGGNLVLLYLCEPENGQVGSLLGLQEMQSPPHPTAANKGWQVKRVGGEGFKSVW